MVGIFVRLAVALLLAAFLAALGVVSGCSSPPRSGLTSHVQASFTPWPTIAWDLQVLPTLEATTQPGWTLTVPPASEQ